MMARADLSPLRLRITMSTSDECSGLVERWQHFEPLNAATSI